MPIILTLVSVKILTQALQLQFIWDTEINALKFKLTSSWAYQQQMPTTFQVCSGICYIHTSTRTLLLSWKVIIINHLVNRVNVNFIYQASQCGSILHSWFGFKSLPIISGLLLRSFFSSLQSWFGSSCCLWVEQWTFLQSFQATPEPISNQENCLSTVDYILLRSSSLCGSHASVQVAVFVSIVGILCYCYLFHTFSLPLNWCWYLIRPRLTISVQVAWQMLLGTYNWRSVYQVHAWCDTSRYPWSIVHDYHFIIALDIILLGKILPEQWFVYKPSKTCDKSICLLAANQDLDSVIYALKSIDSVATPFITIAKFMNSLLERLQSSFISKLFWVLLWSPLAPLKALHAWMLSIASIAQRLCQQTLKLIIACNLLGMAS